MRVYKKIEELKKEVEVTDWFIKDNLQQQKELKYKLEMYKAAAARLKREKEDLMTQIANLEVYNTFFLA